MRGLGSKGTESRVSKIEYTTKNHGQGKAMFFANKTVQNRVSLTAETISAHLSLVLNSLEVDSPAMVYPVHMKRLLDFALCTAACSILRHSTITTKDKTHEPREHRNAETRRHETHKCTVSMRTPKVNVPFTAACTKTQNTKKTQAQGLHAKVTAACMCLQDDSSTFVDTALWMNTLRRT